MKLGLCQLPVTADLRRNHAAMQDMVRRAAAQGCEMVCLPEMWICPYENAAFVAYSEPERGETRQVLRDTAKACGVYLVGGSMPEQEGDRIYNTCFVFSPEGEQIAKHRKVHLFDIDVTGGQHFHESDTLSPGDRFTVFSTPFCRIGLCICYDFRFPELARLMTDAGAKVILVPAAFNMTTGPAHWELLFRSRAVDNQVYTVGTAPARDPNASYQSWGHSIVCSPWGDVLTQADADECVKVTELDLDRLMRIREELPLLKQRRTDLYRVERI